MLRTVTLFILSATLVADLCQAENTLQGPVKRIVGVENEQPLSASNCYLIDTRSFNGSVRIEVVGRENNKLNFLHEIISHDNASTLTLEFSTQLFDRLHEWRESIDKMRVSSSEQVPNLLAPSHPSLVRAKVLKAIETPSLAVMNTWERSRLELFVLLIATHKKSTSGDQRVLQVQQVFAGVQPCPELIASILPSFTLPVRKITSESAETIRVYDFRLLGEAASDKKLIGLYDSSCNPAMSDFTFLLLDKDSRQESLSATFRELQEALNAINHTHIQKLSSGDLFRDIDFKESATAARAKQYAKSGRIIELIRTMNLLLTGQGDCVDNLSKCRSIYAGIHSRIPTVDLAQFEKSVFSPLRFKSVSSSGLSIIDGKSALLVLKAISLNVRSQTWDELKKFDELASEIADCNPSDYLATPYDRYWEEFKTLELSRPVDPFLPKRKRTKTAEEFASEHVDRLIRSAQSPLEILRYNDISLAVSTGSSAERYGVGMASRGQANRIIDLYKDQATSLKEAEETRFRKAMNRYRALADENFGDDIEWLDYIKKHSRWKQRLAEKVGEFDKAIVDFDQLQATTLEHWPANKDNLTSKIKRAKSILLECQVISSNKSAQASRSSRRHVLPRIEQLANLDADEVNALWGQTTIERKPRGSGRKHSGAEVVGGDLFFGPIDEFPEMDSLPDINEDMPGFPIKKVTAPKTADDLQMLILELKQAAPFESFLSN